MYLDSLDPDFFPFAKALVDLAGSYRLNPLVTSTRRSNAEQTRLYRRYLNGQQPYHVAPPGESAHELGLAFDLIVSPMSALAFLGRVWHSWRGSWGGRADPVHFEAPGASGRARLLARSGRSSEDILSRVQRKYLPTWLLSYARALALPERTLLRALEAIPGLEFTLSFFSPFSLPLSILDLLDSFR